MCFFTTNLTSCEILPKLTENLMKNVRMTQTRKHGLQVGVLLKNKPCSLPHDLETSPLLQQVATLSMEPPTL